MNESDSLQCAASIRTRTGIYTDDRCQTVCGEFQAFCTGNHTVPVDRNRCVDPPSGNQNVF